MNTTERPLADTAELPALLPIILADSSSLHRWPTSRVSMPAQFQRRSTGTSPFEDAISNLSKIENLLPPIISLSSASLRPAMEQLEAFPMRDSATLLVAPLDRGTLHSASASALLAEESYTNSLMVFIDCNQPPTDWEAFGRLLRQTQLTPLNKNSIIMCGHPVDHKKRTQLLIERISRTTDPNLYTCKTAEPDNQDTAFELGGVAFSTPDTFLEYIKHTSLNAYTSCNKALQNAEQTPGNIWPNLNIWSLLPFQNLMNTLVQDCSNLLFRPIKLHDNQSIIAPESELIFVEGTENCSIETDGHLIAVAGCENLRIVSTPDATLIANMDSPESLEPILTKLRARECPELFSFPIKYHSWGKETEIDRHIDYSIVRIEIECGQTIPNQSHKQRTNYLHILSGIGEAKVGGSIHPLAPGISIDIPPESQHTLRNLGEDTLVILETRHTEAPKTPVHSAGISASSPP